MHRPDRPRTGARRRLALVGAALTLVALTAPSAQAASPTWQCRGSAEWTAFAGNPPSEPIVAGGGATCTDARAGAASTPQSASVPARTLSTGTVSAQTTVDPDIGPTAAQRIGAVGRVENLALGLPGGAVPLPLTVREAVARASGACVAGRPQLAGSADVSGATLAGRDVPTDQLAARIADAVRPLGAVAEVTVGEQLRDAAGLIQRGLHVRILSAAGTTLLDVVAGEARAGSDGAVCTASTDGGSGTTLPPGTRACPTGSVLDAGSGFCVIRSGVAGALATGGNDIVVGRPFEGPAGGRVISLAEARRRFPRSRCLRGGGPAFAVIGTRKADHVTGTNRRDRILTLGGRDRADGGRGDDCIDGGTSRDALAGGSGRDRVFGSTGNDALNGGPGTDVLDGGRGNDSINAAFGHDRVIGGPGRDVINVATAGPPARVACGAGTDTVRGNANERRRTTGCERRFFLPDRRRS